MKNKFCCEICVHGYDLDVSDGAMVFCPSQKKIHDPDFCCTGFRKITHDEICERSDARFGEAIDPQSPSFLDGFNCGDESGSSQENIRSPYNIGSPDDNLWKVGFRMGARSK